MLLYAVLNPEEQMHLDNPARVAEFRRAAQRDLTVSSPGKVPFFGEDFACSEIGYLSREAALKYGRMAVEPGFAPLEVLLIGLEVEDFISDRTADGQILLGQREARKANDGTIISLERLRLPAATAEQLIALSQEANRQWESHCSGNC